MVRDRNIEPTRERARARGGDDERRGKARRAFLTHRPARPPEEHCEPMGKGGGGRRGGMSAIKAAGDYRAVVSLA